MNTIAERIERGAALLDEKRPGWWQQIDLATLNIREPCNCIGGQLGGGGLLAFGATMTDLGLLGDDEVTACGFDAIDYLKYADFEREHESLTAAWRDLIVKRRVRETVPA